MNRKLKTVIGSSHRWMSAMAVAVLVVAGISSCVNKPIDPKADSNHPMGYALSVEELAGAGTKTPATVMSKLDSVGIYGYYTRTERWIWETLNEPDSLFANRFCNVKLKKSNGWSYSPVQYWPVDPRNKISFFAYAPAVDMATLIANKAKFTPFPLADTVAGIPRITLSVDTIMQKQVDLLWAAALDKSWQDVTNGKVNFLMKHGLAGIKFSAEVPENELDKGYSVRVRSLGVFNVHGRGVMRLDNGQWSYLDTSSDINGNSTMFGNYTLNSIAPYNRLIKTDLTKRNGVPTAPKPAGPYPFIWNLIDDTTDPDVGSFLMVLPQTIEDNEYALFVAELEFTKTGILEPLIMPFPVLLSQIPDANGVVRPWKAGEIIDYRLTITDEFITVRTRSYDWRVESDSDGLVIL